MSSYLVPMVAGLAFGFGIASVVYLGVFIRALKELHEDNVETARLLIENDTNRAIDVTKTATDLSDADENVTRKVTEQRRSK